MTATASEIVGRAAASLGYSKMKPEQEQAILAFVSGKDVFVALPTGYGKSLCFGLLPRVFDLLRGVEEQSVVIVVSPLVALMKEQAASLSSKRASVIKSALNYLTTLCKRCAIIEFRWHNYQTLLSCEGLVSSPDIQFFACALRPCRKIGSGHVHW